MPDLRDRVALVTGASRGVGRGIAEALGEAGATVYVTGRSVSGAPTTEGLTGTVDDTAVLVAARGGRGIAVRCDHQDDAQVEALFARLAKEQGRLDLLVNNVWGGYERYDESFSAPFWEQGLERWQGMFAAGVRAHYTASRLAVPLMLPRKRGLIVNVSAGDRGKFLGTVMYDVAKAAVDRMAFAMGRELRAHGIAAVALHPGFTRTERVQAYLDAHPNEGGAEVGPTETPLYSGRAVVALAADAEILRRSGGAFRVGDLARDYGFTDADGSQPEAFELPDLP